MLIECLIEDGEQLKGLSRTRAEQNPGGNMCLGSKLKYPNVESMVQDAEDDWQIQSTTSTQNKSQQ